MKLNRYLPSVPQITAETLAVLCAALLAAWIISQFPEVKKFVKENSFT